MSGSSDWLGWWLVACRRAMSYGTGHSLAWHSKSNRAGHQRMWSVGLGRGCITVTCRHYTWPRGRPGWSSRTFRARRIWLPAQRETVANDMGFATRGSRLYDGWWRGVLLPLWCVPVAMLLPAAANLAMNLQRAARARAGVCTVCGFNNVMPFGLVPALSRSCLQCRSARDA